VSTADKKLTRQGVTDLGGNRRQRATTVYKQRHFEVDCSTNGGYSGLVLHIEAPSVRDAIRQARETLRRTNTNFEVTQVREDGRVRWYL
jgi:hypothetical protein